MAEAETEVRIRPFWSGTITFGLVSVPVDVYAAHRPRRTSLRMLGEDGTPLRRRYVCPADEEQVPPEHIVRGYEVDGEWVVVTDEELDALEPEKSRDIDLRRFVPRSRLDPVYFQRAYYLAPSTESTKAYRLLARAMEERERAGIATFVMRGREYLVAILAENGILRAETLRFADEVRAPEDVGLPEREEPDEEEVERAREAIGELLADSLPEEELEDRRSERLLRLVEEKREAGEDVVRVPASVTEAEREEEVEVIDLMEALKRRIRGGGAAKGDRAEKGGPGERDGGSGELRERTKRELYDRAKELDIPGRSGMTKEELIEAIRRAS